MTAQAGDTLPSYRRTRGSPGLAGSGSCAACGKGELRKLARQKRRAIGAAERKHCARRVASRLMLWRPLRRARNIAVYLSVHSELPTAPLIKRLLRLGKTLWVPVTGRAAQLRFVPLRRGAKLRRGHFGLPHPARSRRCRPARRMDLILLPLLGFDACGSRLGSGGGYYDRALAGPRAGRRPLLLACAYADQEMAAIPAEPWDVRLDAVVTERGLRRFSKRADPCHGIYFAR